MWYLLWMLSVSLPSIQSIALTPKRFPELASSLCYHSCALKRVHCRKVHQHRTDHILLLYSALYLPCTIISFTRLHFFSRNHCWSPEVCCVYWQYLPGNLYLLVGKALFRALSNARWEILLTDSKKTLQPPLSILAGIGPCLPGLCWGHRFQCGCCWGHGCHSSQEAKMVSQHFCGVFFFCLDSSKQKFTHENIYRNQKKTKQTSGSCCNVLLITIHKVFMNIFIYYLSNSSTVHTLPCTITGWRKQCAARKWKQFDSIIYTITTPLN